MADFLAGQPAALREAFDGWASLDLEREARTRNASFLRRERERYRDFFRTVESSPLTDEQIECVVCFDNRVQVIASAGSGKTSTMVAKAGYALARQIVPADRILMLAFNKKAAAELATRVKKRLQPAGLAASDVRADTFHAFGLWLIGQATGRRPRLAKGLDQADGVGRLQDIVDNLRDHDPTFRVTWDVFRLLYGRDLPPFGEVEEPEDWDQSSGRRGFRTFQGEVVKSQEERMIANWLFYNGVPYEYERTYDIDTADADHGQYRPDFYYPTIDVWHEHFALGPDGRAPRIFPGYEDGVRWKRQTHRHHGTTLVETTSATVRDGTAFTHLAEELTRAGVTLDQNPYRDIPGKPPVRDADLVKLFRTFMIHTKSNQLTIVDLQQRAASAPVSTLRARMFLRLFQPLFNSWEQGLREDGEVDFEDMLNLAADLVEQGWDSPFDLVMVDEMQDASHARARLAAALVAKPGRFLFAVGDDWQSINRFAGADLTVMTRFQSRFGPAEVLRLQRTFRSSQAICDISGGFVSKNPSQLAKRVQSDQTGYSPAVRAVAVRNNTQYAAVVTRELAALDDRICSGATPPGRDGPATVYVLARYNRVKDVLRPVLAKQWKNLTVEFSTIHSAKGKEADYVIIAGMVAGGMPSTIEDDPLLELAMPAGDTFRYAEERRLFYVALTRARRQVLLLTLLYRESPFIVELVEDHHLIIESAAGEPIQIIPCPRCRTGRMVHRTGPYGEFLGCSNFPRCNQTINHT